MPFPIDPAQVIRYQDFRHLNGCESNRRNIYSHRSSSLLMFHVKHQPHSRQPVVMRNHSIFSNENSRQVSDISSSTIESSTKSNTDSWKTNIWQSTNRYKAVANADMSESLDHGTQTRHGQDTSPGIRNSNATDKPTHDEKETTCTYDVMVPSGVDKS